MKPFALGFALALSSAALGALATLAVTKDPAQRHQTYRAYLVTPSGDWEHLAEDTSLSAVRAAVPPGAEAVIVGEDIIK